MERETGQIKLAIVQPRRIEGDPNSRDREYFDLLHQAGRAKADLALLPEDLLGALNGTGFDVDQGAQSIPGPFSEGLAEVAAHYGMWICACQYERDGSALWNTAYLID